MDLPAFLKAERARIGMSQRQLAARLDVSAGLVGRWETGDAPVTPERMLDLCVVFDIAPSKLFDAGEPFAGRLISDPAELALVLGWRAMKAEDRQVVRRFLLGLGITIPVEVDPPQRG